MVTLKILLKILKIENYKQVCDFETPNKIKVIKYM
jgi:hypothetical protein